MDQALADAAAGHVLNDTKVNQRKSEHACAAAFRFLRTVCIFLCFMPHRIASSCCLAVRALKCPS
jgi:hypothetical protein